MFVRVVSQSCDRRPRECVYSAPMTDFDPEALIVRADDTKGSPEQSFVHPLNPKSQVYGVHLSEKVGLKRTGVSHITVPAGKESFAYHSHYGDEEWIYILSGRGVAEVGDAEFEVGAGDFIGFPTPGVGHHLRNPHGEDLVYLMGGEAHEIEVADFPRHGIRMVRRGSAAELYEIDAARPFWDAESES